MSMPTMASACLVASSRSLPGLTRPSAERSLMPLPKLKDITWVTSDCYGTLIDWEKGILDAFNAEAKRDGFSFDEAALMQRFFEIQADIIRGSYELYAEVL